ncbi:MAG TPA: helix-turn-helix domain-containing protein [Candidatus Nanoarchaeia archaeon]|nr:helix-turn-helix domain-containing protein [Candidatus Nanoarchaeia archaeon]
MKEALLQYGLSEKEVEVYLGCLKAGECTANRIAELTGIRRSTVYEVIETLKKKGLLSKVIKDKKYFFIAAKPSSLIDVLKEKERLINESLPALNKLRLSEKEKSEVELIEGISSIKSYILDMLKCKEILIYGAGSAGDEVYGVFTANFAKKRVSQKVSVKAIIGGRIPEHMREEDVKAVTELRMLPALENHPAAYFIYGNDLLMLTVGDPLIAIHMNNPAVVESQKRLFGILWKTAKALN